MIFINSIRNLVRAKKKTVLFFTLLFILTLLVGLDGYVFSAVSGYLDMCDESYTTIGTFEYMGADYPDERIFDRGIPEAFDALSALSIGQREDVLLWEPSARAYGYAEGFSRTDREVYNKNRAVLVIKSTALRDIGLYWCSVMETPYSFHDRAGMLMYVDANGITKFENGHYYLVSGEYYNGPSSYKYFRLQPYQSTGMPEPDPVFLDITDPSAKQGYTVPANSIFSDIAITARALNNSLNVYATANLDTQLTFHQGETVLTEGRTFTDEEYASGTKVCIVSERFLAKTEKKVGDSIQLSLILSENGSAYESLWAGAGFASSNEYQIIGAVRTPETMVHNVFVPSGADPVFEKNRIGYTLGTVHLKNGAADEFYAEMQPLLPERVQLTIYDQGYAAAEKPFAEILRVTKIVTVVCLLAGACILALFGYLFVYRQRDVSVTMLRLGTGKRRVCAYFLYGAGLLSLVSAAAGAGVGFVLTDQMGMLISRLAATVSFADLRYSNAAQSVTHALTFTPTASPILFVIAALGIALLAVLCCLFFTLGTIKRRRVHASRKRSPKQAHFSPRGGRLKYTFLSIMRGGARTVITPVTALLSAVLLCQLTASAASYRQDRENLFAATTIAGSVTDNYGKATGKLAVNGYTPNAFLRSGHVKDLTMSHSYIYLYEGISESGGVRQAYTPVDIPINDFGYETFMDQVMMGPSLIMTNSFEKSPEFYYSNSVQVQYAEGYDASVFTSEEYEGGAIPCLIPTDLANEKGIKPGDHLMIWIFQPWQWVYHQWNLELEVIGTFAKAGSKNNIYCPLSVYIGQEQLLVEKGDPDYKKLGDYSFNNLDFTLTDTANITAFKDWLAADGYSDVKTNGRTRVYVHLNDRSLNDAAESISRQIRSTDVLYPILYVLTGAAGLVAAYLLILNRRREFAIMRVLGTPKRRVFATLFYEQVFLCIPGAALGLLAAFLARIFLPLGAQLSAAFIVFWLLGCALALFKMNRQNVLETIHEEE